MEANSGEDTHDTTEHQQHQGPFSHGGLVPSTLLASEVNFVQFQRPHLRGSDTQKLSAAVTAALSCIDLPHHTVRNEYPLQLRQNQKVPSQLAETANGTMTVLTVAATLLQQNMAELSWAKSEEDRIKTTPNLY
jgi:hypothetical protein